MYSNISQKDDWMYDTDPLRTDSLPPWMEPNTIYLFRYDGENDHSDYFAKINCTEIVWADAVETDGIEVKNNFSFRFELKDKIHVFSTDFGMVTNDWLRAVRCGQKCEEERLRTDQKELKKNVDSVVTAFKQGNSDQILSYCMGEFANSYSTVEQSEDSNPVTDFIKSLKCSQNNLRDVPSHH